MRKLNKRILAVLLVAVLAVGTVLSAMASTDIADVEASGWWVNHSEGIEVTEEGVTVTFHSDSANYDSATNNWNAPIYVLYTADEAFAGGSGISGISGYTEYFVARADLYGWDASGGNTNDGLVLGNWTVVSAPEDWSVWHAECVEGIDCTLTASLADGVVTITLTVGDAVSTAEITVGDVVPYISLTGELCDLTNIAVTYNTTSTSIADVEASGWWVNHSEGIEVTEEGITVTFHSDSVNYDSATNNWNAPIYVLYTADEAFAGGSGISGISGYTEYFVARSDLYGWDASGGNTNDGLVLGNWTVVSAPEDWSVWHAECVEGIDCTLTASLADGVVTITLTVGDAVSTAEITVGDVVPYISLSGELCDLTNIVVTANSTSADDEDATTGSSSDEEETTTEAAAEEETTTEAAAEEETTATATDGTSISYTVTEEVTVSETADDVDITTGFSAHTGEVTISGDFTLEYTFTNTSTGSSNWENFILEMVADGVYLDVRADNYGWFANADENDTLVFGDGSEDWDAWNAAMAAGSDCTVTVVKEGAYIYVTIVAADETFTATAYVAEYEDAALTIYLTGENVSLTNVSYTYTYTTTTTKTDTYSEVVEVSDVVITIESMSDGIDENVVVNYDVYELSEDEQAALEALWEGALSYDVLDIYLTVDGELYEIPDGESIQLRISYSCDSSYETALVLHYVDEDGEWHVIVPDEVGDGYILATFTSLSPVALIVGSSESETETTTSEDENNTDSEEDESTASGGSAVAGGDTATWTYFVMIVAAAAVCVVLAKKRVIE